MRILGLDYGSKTIGVAVSDPLLITAFGLETIRRPEESAIKKSISRLGEIIKEYEINKFVLGYPKHLDNTDSARCVKTLEFKERLSRNFKNIEIILWDERFSSVYAERELSGAGMDRSKINGVVDKIAAVVILQNYLESINRNGVVNGQ